MKLYVNPASPNCRRALLVRAMVGDAVDVEIVDVDMRAGQHKQPAFLAINPNHKVPVLTDGDLLLWESNAIAQYLAARAGRTDLWPTDPAEQADVSRWLFWTHTHWNEALRAVVFERVFKPMFGMGDPDQALIQAGLMAFAEAASVLEGRLATGDWLAAGRLTLADLSLGASLSYALRADVPVADHPRLSAWFGRIRELDAWKASEPPGR
jgi:glutathione S-transferase